MLRRRCRKGPSCWHIERRTLGFRTHAGAPATFCDSVGRPRVFSRDDPEEWARALAGHAVFNGVGANDSDWEPDVKATHEALAAAGIESVYVEFDGQGHSVSEGFDESVFFEFWATH